jgi:hypothetical protein
MSQIPTNKIPTMVFTISMGIENKAFRIEDKPAIRKAIRSLGKSPVARSASCGDQGIGICGLEIDE